jgi:hypothetical protein
LSLAGDALCLAVTALRLGEPTPRVPKQETSNNPPTISLDQVSCHDQKADCWVVIYDQVYDITGFLPEVSVIADSNHKNFSGQADIRPR